MIMPAAEKCGLCASAIDRRHGSGLSCAGKCGRWYHVRYADPPLAPGSEFEVLFGSLPWHCRLCMDNSHDNSSAVHSVSASGDPSLIETRSADISLNALFARLCKVESLCEALVEENSRLRQQVSECLGLRTSVRAMEFRLDSVGSWSMTPGPCSNRNKVVEERLESTWLNDR